ncbi:tape measure protein [Candidatus Endoriftia persephone]|jgi:tape measure domain-containing protein|uniref:Tape measure protein n=1 Tax=Candidatus Endoriftia persephonae TaxID=393765 RepID=A0A9J7A110_9GAMM|nr:tape measure protein [Candidatus Endoriftia persephone]USF88749.1 tape measure protein [Candidatus Endoriftia persephone]
MPAADKEFLIRVKADIEKAVADMRRMAAAVEKEGRSASKSSRGNQALGGSFRALAAGAAAYFSVATLIQGLKLADEFNVLQQRIKAATRESGDYAEVSKEIYAITQRNGSAMADTVSVFQSLARSSKELGAANTDILKVTEAVQQLGIISGASQGAMSAGLLQFGQAMAAGVVRAEEMNSLLENIPEVANRIAKGMGMTVGQMRAAVLEGKLLSKDVFNALLKQALEIADQFKEMPLSLDRASQMLSTSFGNFLSQLDQATGFTSFLAEQMQSIARGMDNAGEYISPTGLNRFNLLLERRLELEEQINGIEWSSKNQPTESLRRQLAGLKSDLDAVNKEMADMQEQKRLASMSQESQAAIKSARSELTQLRDDLSTVDTEIAAKSTQLLGMDPVNTTAEMDQLGAELARLKKRQRELTKAVQESESAYNRVLSAGVESTGSTKAQQQQLATQMDLVKEKLQAQITLFGRQKEALLAAKQAAAEFDAFAASAATTFKTTGAPEADLGLKDVMAQMRTARAALDKGDNQQAVQEAKTALDLINKVKAGGKESEAILKYFLNQATLIGKEASAGLVDGQQAAFEQTKGQITSLLADAERLKSLQVSFDQEQAALNAEFLRASLQEEFNNNPLELPVILRKPNTGNAKLIDKALENLPGKAGGGLLRGPGSGTSDSILMWGSNGEYMMRESAVRHYGSGFFDRLNQMQIPRYVDGGLISAPQPSINFPTPQAASGRPITLVLNGDRYAVSADNDTADQLERRLSLSALKRGSRL